MLRTHRTSLFLVSAFFTSTARAQIFHHRQQTPARIIAGAVIGGVFALFLVCLVMKLTQRRRAQTYAVTHGGAQPKPLFGAPWGRTHDQNGIPMYGQGGQGGQGVPNYPVPPQSHGNPSYNTEYPKPNAPLPPPAYIKDAEYNGQYTPPPGAPPPVAQVNSQQSTYAPPPGPPPAAHTTGKDDTFVGGFRN